ncbi:hypothetical protein [Streptococcus sobrinus]|uniref:AbrB family transcriptional regulator n=1 Tax=Streptococcus sobrinus TaxID=1310 RepID=A0ABM6W661_9STRE|nr:hypothetical protein [Streptococcus sobrinus]AWN20927.1 AbrB family transcriptional regulator [Streptococcus sobrinus]SQG13708.1 MazE/ChpS family antitoxin [Streptococcus sobrinus]
MKSIKIQQVGDNLVLVLPEDLGIQTGQEFDLQVKANGVIRLIPLPSNPFQGDDDLRMTDDFEDIRLLDQEIQ